MQGTHSHARLSKYDQPPILSVSRTYSLIQQKRLVSIFDVYADWVTAVSTGPCGNKVQPGPGLENLSSFWICSLEIVSLS